MRINTRKSTVVIVLMALLGFAVAFSLIGCSSSSLSLDGMWSASDGSTKIFGSNGACQGMMPIDIGGPQTYTLSSGKDSSGRYTLMISQPPNERTLYVKDSGGGKVEVYEGGKLLWTMTKK